MEAMLQRWGSHSAVIGFQPINEPTEFTPLDYLKDYYRRVRKLVKRYAPQAYFVFHESFRFSWDTWKDLFAPGDWNKVAVDHNGYTAWANKPYESVQEACDFIYDDLQDAAKFREAGCEVWWGEWSLATDNCALWLDGFNDVNPDYPKRNCKSVDCPISYMPADQFDTSFNRESTKPLGPWGDSDQTLCGITGGKCWTDAEQFSNEDVGKFAKCILEVFDNNTDAHFMWTARTEFEDKWSYVKSWDNMWINTTEVVNKTGSN